MPYKKSFIDQASWLLASCSSCVYMDLDSVNKNAKRELGQYPAILTSRLVNNLYVSFPKAVQRSGNEVSTVHIPYAIQSVSEGLPWVPAVRGFGSIILPIARCLQNEERRPKTCWNALFGAKTQAKTVKSIGSSFCRKAPHKLQNCFAAGSQ